jgi:hypothetical protein
MFLMGGRPIGVTVIAAGLVLLGGAGLVIAVIMLLNPGPAPDPHCSGMLCNFDWRGLVTWFAKILAVAAVWPLVTGAGLLGRFDWARYSAMALSIVLFALGIYAAKYSFGLLLTLPLMILSPLAVWYFARNDTRAWFSPGADEDGQAAG